MVNAARLKDSGERNDGRRAWPNTWPASSARRSPSRASASIGGYSYSKEYEIERLMRDALFPAHRGRHQRDSEEHHQQAASRRLPDLILRTGFTPRPQLAEDVAHFVRRRIFNGTYPAGGTSGSTSWRRLGISVTPVREALFNWRGGGCSTSCRGAGSSCCRFTDRPDITDVSPTCRPRRRQLAARAAASITDERCRIFRRSHDRLTGVRRRAATTGRCGSTEFPPAPSMWPRTRRKLAQLMSITRARRVGVPRRSRLAGTVGNPTTGASSPPAGHDADAARAACPAPWQPGRRRSIGHLVKQGVAQQVRR